MEAAEWSAAAQELGMNASPQNRTEFVQMMRTFMLARTIVENTSTKKRDCERKCKAPQYNGNPKGILTWEKESRRALEEIWDDDADGYGSYAIRVFRDSFCGNLHNWAQYIDAERIVAQALNFGQAWEALVAELMLLYGIDKEEIQYEALQKFRCLEELKAPNFPMFWIDFITYVGEAGLIQGMEKNKEVKRKLINLIPNKFRYRLDQAAQSRSSEFDGSEKAEDLTFEEIRSWLTHNWKGEPTTPQPPKCDNKNCESGLPAEKCPCNARVAAQTSPRQFNRNCNRHDKLSTEQDAAVRAALKGLPMKKDDSGTSPNFRACQKMGVCNRCLGKFKEETFNTWWNERR